jgi:dihydrofolate reductase
MACQNRHSAAGSIWSSQFLRAVTRKLKSVGRPGSNQRTGAPKAGLDRRYAYTMRPLRYSINVTLDGCCDHREMFADGDLHRHAMENIVQADALLFGRVTYEMMQEAWRLSTRTMTMPEWTEPFARTIDAAKKYVVSSTLDRVDWNAELLRGDLGHAVQQLKRQPGKGLFTGGLTLPRALAELGLIDEYEFIVHPRVAGYGPTLFAGLSKRIDLKLVSRMEFGSGAVAMRYHPRT